MLSADEVYLRVQRVFAEKEKNMPKNTFERAVYALMTVFITVIAFVFYSLYVVNGEELMRETGQTGVLGAISEMGGVYMAGDYFPIWTVILVEIVLAFTLAFFIGSPMSLKIVRGLFEPKSVHPVIFKTAVVCVTVCIMCPSMSFLAALLYYPYYAGFDALAFIAYWLKLVCFNFPFAFFTQLFFIQPLVRFCFRMVFGRKSAAAQYAR